MIHTYHGDWALALTKKTKSYSSSFSTLWLFVVIKIFSDLSIAKIWQLFQCCVTLRLGHRKSQHPSHQMISRAFKVLITQGPASTLALGRPYGLGICCIYIEKHTYIINAMLHKNCQRGGKTGQGCRELHQTISLEQTMPLSVGWRQREVERHGQRDASFINWPTFLSFHLVLFSYLEPELHYLCSTNPFSTLKD